MDVLKDAQLILTVTSSIHDVIRPEHLQPGVWFVMWRAPVMFLQWWRR
jgi:hypothetical protein